MQRSVRFVNMELIGDIGSFGREGMRIARLEWDEKGMICEGEEMVKVRTFAKVFIKENAEV